MKSFRWLYILSLLMTILIPQTAGAQQPGSETAYEVKSGPFIGLDLTAEFERWGGYTEYEIDVGTTTYGPTGESVSVGSRLRFPIGIFALRLQTDLALGSFSLRPNFVFNIANSGNTFKDYDWYEGTGGQTTFIYGVADNDESMFGLGFSAGYGLKAGKFRFMPKFDFTWMRFVFDNENLTQFDYAYFDGSGRIYPLDEAHRYDTTGAVIRYTVNYIVFSLGGEVTYESPFGVYGMVDLLFSPITIVDDLDEHLLRGKDSEISATGTSGMFELRTGYRVSPRLSFYGGISYRYIKTSGDQDQTIPRSDGSVLTTTIPATTLAEWTTFSLGLTFSLNSPDSN